MKYSETIDKSRIPAHIAIIMDGNGRWAKQQGLPRVAGHKAGIDAVERVMTQATKLGVQYLTLYTFSTENWNRPPEEVAALMTLLIDNLEEEIFMKNSVRLRVIGDRSRLPQTVLERIDHCVQRTAGNTKSCMVIALSYSSKWEITQAVRNIARRAADGTLDPEQVDEELIEQNLTTNFMPAPDLLIRTGGEQRLSNFLLWQCAYTEFYFCDTYWPDFDGEALCQAIDYYQQRERRYGKTSEQLTQNEE